MTRKLYAEDYLYLIQAKYEGKKILCKDDQRIIPWCELVQDFMIYEMDNYDSIFDYIDANVLGPNGNCELINK